FADLTDKTSIDYLVRDLTKVDDKPYVFHLGAQAHVGESWHRPYETVVANTLGTLNLLQSIVDHGLELEKFDTAGTSEEYGSVRGHLTVAAHGIPGDVYVYGQGENISMDEWAKLILRVGEEAGYWPAGREVVSTAARFRPGASEVMALRVGFDKLHKETGWEP